MKVDARKISKLGLIKMIIKTNDMLFTAYNNAYPGVLYLLKSYQQRPVSLQPEGKFLSQVVVVWYGPNLIFPSPYDLDEIYLPLCADA